MLCIIISSCWKPPTSLCWFLPQQSQPHDQASHARRHQTDHVNQLLDNGNAPRLQTGLRNKTRNRKGWTKGQHHQHVWLWVLVETASSTAMSWEFFDLGLLQSDSPGWRTGTTYRVNNIGSTTTKVSQSHFPNAPSQFFFHKSQWFLQQNWPPWRTQWLKTVSHGLVSKREPKTPNSYFSNRKNRDFPNKRSFPACFWVVVLPIRPPEVVDEVATGWPLDDP